ncbi:hypothetical protein D1007_57241 [Hordeum vulgare]|nr:hypothetical protein D1007_57241 [Hordeum vulgare]
MVPLHFHGLLSGVVPPFSGFLSAVHSHYQIHTLHLDPRSLVLLSAFAFLCEAFVGVTPSVALLRHLFPLELVSEVQCSGCASLKRADATVPGALYAELLLEAEGFWRQWVHVEAAEARALFKPPLTPATPNQGWEREELSDPRLTPVLIWLEKLRHAGVTVAMVVHEFICRRIAPLQCHSRPMWAYKGPSDSMRTQVVPFSPDVFRELLCPPTGGNPDELPPNDLLLYSFKAPGALVTEMPLFDEWGLLLEGERRPPEASTLGVQPREKPGRAVTSATRVGGAPLPAVPTLALHPLGLVVAIGRWWKAWPPLPSLTRGGEDPWWPLEPIVGSPAAPWGLLRSAADALQCMGARLASHKARRQGERQHHVSVWRLLEVAMNLGRVQWASEVRHRELCALITSLEEQAPPRASLGCPSVKSFLAGPRASADSLVLVEVEQSLEHDRLEMRERSCRSLRNPLPLVK